MGKLSVSQILEHNFLNPNDYLDRKWLTENGPVPTDVSAIWKAEDHIGTQLKKMIDASGEPAYDYALKLQMQKLLEENMGINQDRAKSLIDTGYVGKVTNRQTEKPNAFQAAGDTFLATHYNQEMGKAYSKYMFTGDERFKQVADSYAEKEKQHRVGTDDWGFFGNRLVGTAQIAGSTTSSVVGGVAITGLTTLAGSIIGGPAGAVVGNTVGKALSTAFVMMDSGSAQAGADMYALSQLADENGQTIDLESPISKAIFLTSLLANGAIEVVGMDFMPGYKQLIDAVGPSIARDTIKSTFKQSMAKYGKEVLEGAFAEGAEEFFQGWVSDLSNNLITVLSNSKKGTSFDTKNAGKILTDSLTAFVDTAKNMVTYGMLTGGVGNGVRAARMKIESNRNQTDADGSVTIDSSFLHAKEADTESEYLPEGKLPPIKVIRTESGVVPATVDDAKTASFLKFNKKASAVKIIPVEAKVASQKHEGTVRNLAYQLDLKVDENGRFVADSESALSEAVSQVQNTLGVISSKKNDDGSTTFSLLDQNKESVDFTIGLADQESKLTPIEPDYGAIDTKLQRILKPRDRYLDAEEHEFVRNRVLESLDGNFSENDVEAGVNSIMIAARALGMNTDEFLDHHIQVRFATDDDALQVGQPDARGWLEKPEVAGNGDVIHTIRLTKNADESTIVHETGHVLRKLASPEQLKSFAEVYGGSVGSMWAEDIQEDNGKYLLGNQSFASYAEAFNAIRENEERFADDFVAYLMDGVAPTEEMKGLFSRMKEFLRSVYHQFKDRLSDETRQAFEKLFLNGQSSNQNRHLAGDSLFQESHEYQAVVSRYKDTPEWMKAPNGQPTNLTERQWVLVRTPSFKKRFGDWEAAVNFKWLMESEPVVSLSGEELKENIVDNAFSHYQTLGNVVFRPGLGEVTLTRHDIQSSIAHGLGRIKASAFIAVPEVIRMAREFSRVQDYKGRGYDSITIAAPIDIKGVDYICEVVINKRPSSNNFYLHEVEVKEKLQFGNQVRNYMDENHPNRNTKTEASRLIIARMLAEGKFHTSVELDENGEPLESAFQNKEFALFQNAADQRYFKALKEGDEETARKIIDDQARRKGYVSNNDFRMNHKAPNSHDGFSARLDKLDDSELLPKDYWRHPNWYTSDDREMRSFWKVKEALDRYQKNGSAKIRLYRAIPKNIKEDWFRNGDWVTPDRDYAVDEGQGIPEGYRIVVHQVPIEHVWWDVNSIAELGYDDGGEYVYRDTKNNRKLNDTIVKDEYGNIVPPSKRFNNRNAEIFFQKGVRLENKDIVTIDGIDYVKHDLGHEWNKDRLDELSTEVAGTLAGILAQSGVQYELDFGDQSTNGSLFVDQPSDEALLNVRSENGINHRGYSPLRGWDGTEESPRIDEDWKRFRKIDFTGYTIKSSNDLAQLFSIYRNPQIEYFHVIFTKGDKIVAHHALTNGLPGRAFAIDKNYPDSVLQMKKAYKADGYYLLHNHPSGDTTPSDPDINVTKSYILNMNGFKGHIILNHNKYGVIEEKLHIISQEQLISSGFHEIPARHLVSPETVNGPADIASLAKGLMDDRSNLILYLDGQHRVVLAEPSEIINAKSIYEKIIGNSFTSAAVVTSKPENFKQGVDDYKIEAQKHGGFLTDIVFINIYGKSFASANEVGMLNNSPYTWQESESDKVRGNQEFLFQLSDQKQKELLQNRKYEVKQLVEGHFYIKDELLEEFAGEDWADEEIRFRKVVKEFPWVLDAARKFDNVEEYLESLRNDPMYETSEYEWHEEDEQWFRRIFDYSQIPTPDDLDRQFVQQYTTDPDMLVRLARKMSNYEDLGAPIQHRTHKQPTFIRRYGAFKGVSTKFLRLTNKSSLADVALVANMIQSNPRPYRKALQVVDQAESRVMAAKGIGGRENIAYEYYSAFGEDLEDELKKLQEESEEQAKQQKLNSLPKEVRNKTTYEIAELDQQSESILQNLGEKGSTVADLSKRLETATAIAKGLTSKLEAMRTELKQSKQAYSNLSSELRKEELKLNRRDARVASLLEKLVQTKQANASLAKELDETQRDMVSQAEWRAFFENLAELRGKRVHQQEQNIRDLVADLQDRRERVKTLRGELTAANRENHRLENALQAAKNREVTRKFRQAFKEVQARIIKNSTFNGNTMDAFFEESMRYVNNLFNKDVISYPREFPSLLKDYMPEWFGGYESIPRGDNRMASWSIDELLAIDAAAQMMATDARVKKVSRDGEIQARRQQIALRHFRQIYDRMPELQVSSVKPANVMADIAEDVNTTKQKYHNGQEGNLSKTWHNLTMSFAHIQRIARLVDGNREGAIYDLFVRDLWDGYNAEHRESQRRLSALEEKRKALGITDQYLAQELASYKAGGATEISLTREEAIGVYIYSRNKMSMEKLLSHGGNGMSVFDLWDIVAKLEKKDIEFGDYLIDSIGGDGEYGRLKAATYKIYNINLGREEHYFPLRAKGVEVEGSADLITGPTKSSISYIDKGMTVERVHAKYQVDLAVLNTWQDVMRQQEHLMALGQWVKDANYLLGPNGAVGHTISTNFGSTVRQALQDFVNRVAGQKDNARYVSKIFNNLLSKASASMISYNVSSMMKQTASLAAVLRGGINPIRFFQMMLSPTGPHPQLKNWKAARNLMYELAPDMKSRTFNVEVQRFRNLKNTTQAGRVLKKVTDFGLEYGTGAVDSIVVTRLWWAAYMTALDKGMKSDDAVFKASQFIAESQSTTNQMDMSLIQQSENSFFRIITQFRNDAFQHWNQIFFDLPYHLRNKMWLNAAGDLTSVLIAGTVITLATGAFLGKGGDDEEWWKRFIRALFPNLLGEFIPYLGEGIATSFNGYSSGGILSFGSDIGNFIREATDDDGDYQALGDRVWDMIASLGTTAGVPTLAPKRIMKAIEEQNPWRLIGGYWYRMWEDAQ